MLLTKPNWLESLRAGRSTRRRKSLTRQHEGLVQAEKLEDRQLLSGTTGHHVMATLALVPADQADFVTTKSGDWSDPATWASGEVPTENGQVLIGEGHTVLFDAVQTERTEWIRVDGTLQFDHTVDTHLFVETLVVGVNGELIIGTEANPIGADGSGVTARVTIADAGEAFDHSVDMQELGRGIIAMGRVEMHGADVTEYSGLATQPMAGDTEFVLDAAPENWDVGDRLVTTSNEVVTITGIGQNEAGQTVVSIDNDPDTEGVQGLARNYATPEGYDQLTHYVGNLDRNVVIESENPDIINRRGHVMFMHNQNVEINNAGFYGLGRTDKGKLINDVSMDPDGNHVPGTNVRGRYAVHFHRAGTSADATPGHVEGSVVVGSPGWGYVNHDSYVNMYDNIAYNVKGAAFAQELGNERGTFTRNLAINTYGGTGNWRTPIPDRQPLFDWGFAGHGFWLHSPSVSVIDNISAGSNESGFAYFGKGAGGGGNLTNFIGNTNIGGKMAMLSWKFSRPQIVFEDFTVWNTGGVLFTQDYSNITFKDSLFVKNLNSPSGEVVGGAYGGGLTIKHYKFDNTTIVGFDRIVPGYQTQTFSVTGGYYNNLTSFQFGVGNGTKPRFENVTFGELSEAALNGRTQSHIKLGSIGLETPNFRQEFVSRGVGVLVDGQQLYLDEQAHDFVYFPNARPTVPDQFVGKTNQQLLDEFGVTPGGAIAPADSVRVPGFDGLLGEPSSADSALATLLSREYTNQLDNYLVSFRTADGQVITETEPTASLREGWNAITRDVNGTIQTVFVWGDITPPVFQEDNGFGRIDRSVEYSQLSNAFRMSTRVFDAPMSSQKIGFTLRGLNTLPIQGSVQQGNVYVTKFIGFTDWAGNQATPAEVRIKIKNYPRPPIAWGDSATVTTNTATVINVLKNDYDRDGDPLTIINVSDPAHGSVALSNNQITYTSNAGYTGKDSFNYTISDGKGGTAQASVNITVQPADPGSPPVAVNDFVSVTSGQGPVTVDVLANDSDPDGDNLTIVSLNRATLHFGTIEQVDNKLVYTPRPDVIWADDGLFYTISDGNGNTAMALLGFQIRPGETNNAPDAVDDVYATGYEEVLEVLDSGVLANDTDSNGDSLTASLASGPANGSVTVNADGGFSYTPNAGFSGVDSFTYTADDGNGGNDTATVEVTVEAPVNNAPIENLALKGTASQSSTGWGGVASRAIDGNTNSRWRSRTITHTQHETGASWQVELEQKSDLEQIKLWNRSDGRLERRLTNFRVSVLDGDTEVFGQDYFRRGHVHQTNGFTIDLPEGVKGDRVRVRLNGRGYLSLAEVQVMGRSASAGTGGGQATGGGQTGTGANNAPITNLALQGTASQSSTGWGGSATRAIDGNTNSRWRSGTITATRNTTNPSWQVSLEQKSDLEEIKLWNRSDGRLERRLTNFRVSVFDGDTEVFGQNYFQTGHVHETQGFTIDLPEGIAGDRVKVQLNGRGILSLAEVQVMGRPDGQAGVNNVSVTNLARQGSASQSSTGWGGVASRANDGNTSSLWGHGSITATTDSAQPWWEVELEQKSDLEQIKLFNRSDGSLEQRLTNFRVSVFDGDKEVFGQNYFQTGHVHQTNGFTINLPEGVSGDRVRVQLNGRGILSLAEVQVMGRANSPSH